MSPIDPKRTFRIGYHVRNKMRQVMMMAREANCFLPMLLRSLGRGRITQWWRK
jgi:hypothetical protein